MVKDILYIKKKNHTNQENQQSNAKNTLGILFRTSLKQYIKISSLL